MKEKISLFCDVDKEAVIEAKDSETIYEIPMVFEQEGLANLVVKRLGLHDGPANMAEWHDLVRRVKQPQFEVNISVVGKYTGNGDAYISHRRSPKARRHQERRPRQYRMDRK